MTPQAKQFLKKIKENNLTGGAGFIGSNFIRTLFEKAGSFGAGWRRITLRGNVVGSEVNRLTSELLAAS